MFHKASEALAKVRIFPWFSCFLVSMATVQLGDVIYPVEEKCKSLCMKNKFRMKHVNHDLKRKEKETIRVLGIKKLYVVFQCISKADTKKTVQNVFF